MDRRLLLAMNIIGTLAFLVLYLTGIVPFSPYLASILFFTLLYVNIRQAALEFIDYYMLMDVIPVDVTRDDRLRGIEYMAFGAALIAGIALCGFAFLGLPQVQLAWAVAFTAYIVIAVCLFNVFTKINYLFLGRVPVNRLSMAAVTVIVLLLWAFAWTMLPREQFIYALMAGFIIFLLPALYYSGRTALAIVKKVNARPANVGHERKYEIFNAVALFAFVAIIVSIRLLPPPLNLLAILAGPIFLTILAVNAWKITSDIRPEHKI